MSYNYKPTSFYSILSDLDKAAIWIKNLCQINLLNSRIPHYQKDIRLALEAIKNKNFNSLDKPQIINSLYEAAQIIDIWKGLHTYAPNIGLINKLLNVIKGPISTWQETQNSRNARDLAFELFMASRLSLCGYKINYNTLADVATLHPRKLLVECKRPEGKTQDSLQRNIKKAVKQLEKKYKDADEIGVISISINKLVNPVQRLQSFDCKDDLNKKISNFTKIFTELTRHWWFNLSTDKRTLVFITSIEMPCFLKDAKEIVHARQFSITNARDLSTQEREFEFFKTFSKQFISSLQSF